MKSIIVSLLLMSMITAIARFILPKIEIFVMWLINKFVCFSEKKVKGSNMGAIKKKKVLKWLKWFGVKSTNFVDILIDSAVDVMNAKRSDMASEIQNDVADKVVTKLEDTATKVVK